MTTWPNVHVISISGLRGVPGVAGTIEILPTVTTAAGSNPDVENEGNATHAELRFYLPHGGAPGVGIAVETVANLRLVQDPTLVGVVTTLGCNAVNDGGGGLWRWDVSETANDNTGTVVESDFDANGRWVRAIDGEVNVKWFGAVGDGTTDDSAAIQAAIDAAGEKTLVFPNATYVCGELVVAGEIDLSIEGNGSTLSAAPGSAWVLWCKRNISSTRARFIQNLNIQGNSIASIKGLHLGMHGTDPGAVQTVGDPNRIGAALHVKLSNVTVDYCHTAFYLPVMMECHLQNCNARYSTCGFWVRTDSYAGGGNANDFAGCSATVCYLGVFLDGSVSINSSARMANNVFTNLVLQGCGIAFAAIKSTRMAFNGLYTEATNTGTTHWWSSGANLPYPVTFNSVEFPRSTLYFETSALEATGVNLAETIAPGVYLTGGSHVTFGNVSGFGTSGDYIYAESDADTVAYQGTYAALGDTNARVINWPMLSDASTGVGISMKGLPSQYIDETLPTQYAGNSRVPTLQNAAGGSTINGTVADDVVGVASQVTFAASIGSASANRVTLPIFPSAVSANEYVGVSFLVRASAETSLKFIGTGNYPSGSQTIGTSWTRVTIFGKIPATMGSGINLFVYPLDAVGAEVKFAKLTSYVTADAAVHVDYGTRLLQGAWNPGNKTEVHSSAAPSVGTWRVGDIVWNTAPASAGSIGWVCTVAGTPGTWNSFGVIA